MRILHVIESLPNHAGTSVFCLELCEHLQAMGDETAIAVCHPKMQGVYPSRMTVPVVDIKNVGSTPWRPDIVQIHGLWGWQLHRCARLCVRERIPYIVSPHGMLAPWAFHFKGWKKSVAWHLYQQRDAQSANALHATAEAECCHLRAMGLDRPVAIVPLGMKLPGRYATTDGVTGVTERGSASMGRRRVLFLGRIHPVKGLANLVQAWHRIGPRMTRSWQLVIAGPDDYAYKAKLTTMARDLGMTVGEFEGIEGGMRERQEDVLFIGPVCGTVKDTVYRSAHVFVLPSFSENFGAVVPEALGYGLPVIATKGTPWSQLEGVPGKTMPGGGRCGWWVDVGIEPLTRALLEAMSLTEEERHVLGANGRLLVETNYRWDVVAARMRATYGWILGRNAPPSHIQLSGPLDVKDRNGVV